MRVHKGIHWKISPSSLASLLGVLGVIHLIASAEAPAAPSPLVIQDGLPAIPARITDRVKIYQDFPAVMWMGWQPDTEGMYVLLREHGQSFNRSVSNAGGSLLASKGGDMDGPPLYDPRPGTRTAVFVKDQDGNENNQFYRFHLDTGATTLLTDGVSKHDEPIWSRDGRRIVFSTNQRNGKDMDIAMLDPDRPGSTKRLTEAPGYWLPQDIAPDGKRVAVRRYVSINESYLSVLDVDTKRLMPCSPTDRKIACDEAQFSGDGTSLFYISGEWGGTLKIARTDLASGRTLCLTPRLDWNADHLAPSPDGRWLAYTTNEEGMSRLHLMDLSSCTSQVVPGLPIGLILNINFDRSSKRLAVSMNTYQSPGDVYVVSIPSLTITRWTTSESAAIPSGTFTAPTLIRFPTFDQVDGRPRTIPAFYYRPLRTPHSVLRTEKFPVVILIHGGPEIQERASFNPTCQYLMKELGVAIITPNVRGSDGYGQEYLNLDNGLKREDAVKDIGALLDWIAAQPELDASRVAVMGGSYGGYLSLASMVHFSDRLACGIDTVGISNFLTYFEKTQPYRRDVRRPEYGDERDPVIKQFFEAIAPANRANAIKKPLLIVHGANDPRVPVEESEQIVKAVRANGQSAWLLIFKNEGHGRPALGFGRFHHPENDLLYSAAMIHFLGQHLLEGPPAP